MKSKKFCLFIKDKDTLINHLREHCKEVGYNNMVLELSFIKGNEVQAFVCIRSIDNVIIDNPLFATAEMVIGSVCLKQEKNFCREDEIEIKTISPGIFSYHWVSQNIKVLDTTIVNDLHNKKIEFAMDF
jgi:hypothetical protein